MEQASALSFTPPSEQILKSTGRTHCVSERVVSSRVVSRASLSRGMTQESENPTRLKLLGLGGMHMNVHTRKVATQDTSLARLSVKMALVMFSHTLLMPRCLRLVLTVPVRFSGYLHVAEWLWLVWFDIHGLGNAASRSDHSQVC